MIDSNSRIKTISKQLAVCQKEGLKQQEIIQHQQVIDNVIRKGIDEIEYKLKFALEQGNGNTKKIIQ